MGDQVRDDGRRTPAGHNPSDTPPVGSGKPEPPTAARDWRETALGAPEAWPPSLHAAIRICLHASSPLLLWWGPELILVYNEAARPLLGDGHPSTFGARAEDCPTEIRDISEDAVERVRATGQPSVSASRLVLLRRQGSEEEHYVETACSPVLQDGEVAGVFCVVEEVTARVLAARRSETLAALAERLGDARSEDEAWLGAAAALGRDPADLPFVLLYRVAEAEGAARLAGAVGIPSGSERAPQRIDLAAPHGVWPLSRIARTREAETAGGALVLPVVLHETSPYGFLVAGLSPRQPFDATYRQFLELASERLAAGLRNVRDREAGAQQTETLEALRRRLERRCAELTHLFDQAPVPMAVLRGADFVVETANAAARDTIRGRETVGRPLLEAVPEFEEQGLDAPLRRVLETGEPQVGREVLVKLERDGRIEDVYFTFICAPLREEAPDAGEGGAAPPGRERGEPAGGPGEAAPGAVPAEVRRIITIAPEVTTQVRAQAAIRASEARYRSIFESVDVSIWEEDYTAAKALLDELGANGVTDLRAYFADHPEFLQRALDAVEITGVNDVTLRLLGARDRDELLSSLQSIFLPETLEAFGQKLIAIAENIPILRTDTALRTLRGERRDVILTMTRPGSDASDHGPHSCRALVTLSDITERKRMEQALREADRQKDEFLATLAHELRNPLAPLRSCTDLLRTTDAGAAVPNGLLDIIERQIDHLIRLVDDLLESSRIRRGAFELRRERVTLARIVRDALESNEPLIRAAGHELSVSVPEEPVWLDGDPVRLEQVLGNLLNNAVKYTRPGGRISLSVHREGDTAAISVADTGIGIAPESLPQLFTMFSRVGGPGGDGFGGLGIGLALARRLIELHGGTIEAHSEGPGKGSEFTVRLPIAPSGAEAGPAHERAAAEVEHRRVLVVDDNADAAESLRMVLDAIGADVRVADSGPHALSMYAGYQPDVVLLDIGMPGMSGHEVARRLRTDFPEHHATLVAVTGWGTEEDSRRAREAGFDRHLVKPVDAALLRELLASLDDVDARTH